MRYVCATLNRFPMREFTAVIQEAPRGGAWIEIPFDAKAVFGSGRPKVVATFDGSSYRGSIASMGGRYVLGVAKAIRESLGKGPGDTLEVTVALDDTPRIVDVPEALAAALAAAELRETFDGLSYTRRREYAEAVASARKPATRQRRIRKTIEELGG